MEQRIKKPSHLQAHCKSPSSQRYNQSFVKVIKSKLKYLDKPLFTYFCAGYPSAEVQFISEAAKELGINLKVEYHGCIIRTLYSDEYGLKISDVEMHKLEIEEKK